MIYIEKNEKVPLPKRYHKVNNLCAIIYDQLTDIYKSENYRPLNGTEFNIKKEEDQFIADLQNGKIDILDWLKTNKRNDDLVTILTKHITMSVVSDFVNFIYESLSCAKRGKMSVAYALLRKPLTDELLILEQILFDPHEFIQRFYHSGDPASYDPSHGKIDKREIIRNALSKAKPNIIFTEDLIYELRYDKSSPSGINGISNHALHIVTSDKNYKTPNQNLNFVFWTKGDMEYYWEHYYYFVPYLLIYSVSIIDGIIFNYLPDQTNEDIRTLKSFRRLIGLLIWMDKSKLGSNTFQRKIFKNMSNTIKIECKDCKQFIELTKPDFELFFNLELLLCPKCFRNVLTSHESVKSIKEFIEKLT